MSIRFSRRSFFRASAAAAAALGAPLLPASAAETERAENGLFSAITTLRPTRYGPVQGTDQNGHLVWYGIPYGAAPVGESRWASPQEPEHWVLARDCSSPAPAAYQYNCCPLGSEDCLKLDIYSVPQARKRPVLVWLHSSFLTGSAREMPGGALAERAGCVFVGLDYRLGFFGWSCLPALTDGPDATGNFALLDIARALDWVRDNISAFGGDPANITLCGFADGGRLVLSALSSPLFHGRFQRAISLSGGISRTDPASAAAKQAQAFAPLAVEDGLFGDIPSAAAWLLTADPAVREWLLGLEPSRIAALSADIIPFPCLFADGITLPESSHIQSEVPLLLMSSATEFSSLVLNAPLAASDASAAFAIRYGSRICQWSSTEAVAQSCTGSAPVWLGLMDYGSADSRTSIPVLGSYHGILPALLAPESIYAACADFSSAGAQALSARMQQLFGDFMRSGTPGWESWNAQERSTLRLDADAGNVFTSVSAFPDEPDSIFAAMDADATLTPEEKQAVTQNFFSGWYFELPHTF